MIYHTLEKPPFSKKKSHSFRINCLTREDQRELRGVPHTVETEVNGDSKSTNEMGP